MPGLENLTSVFSDLSKNALADNEPLVSPDIGNQSGYRDISKNYMERVTSANTLVGDYHGDVNSFGRFSPNPIMDSVFANKSIQLTTHQSLIKDDEHTFGSKGKHDKLILINEIGKGQIDSPIARDVLDGEFTTLARRSIDVRHKPNIFGETDLKLYGEHSGKMIDPDIRKVEVSTELGKNNRLGEGDFVFDTLYNRNQTAKTDRILIDTGRTTGDGKKVTINTMAWSIGQAWSNMDIRSTPDGVRGNEPYVVNDIGSVEQGTIRSGDNRDLLPFNQSKEDWSRLSKFYFDTPIGTSFMVKENVTGAMFSSMFTISPTKIWDGYPGKIDWSQPIAVIQKYIRDTFADLLGSLVNTSNVRLLATNIHLPPFPMPGWGNTGFLNFLNSSFQGLGGGSIRRPGTIAFQYSNLVKSGFEDLSKVYQLGVFTNLIDELNPLAGKKVRKFNLPKRQPVTVKEAITNRKNFTAVKDAVTQNPALPFLKLVANTAEVKPKWLNKEIDLISNDKIASQKPTGREELDIASNDFYVKIKDLRNNKLLYFRGYVTGLTENVNPTFTSTNYIGRSEPVYLYERAERDLSFNLRLYPNNKDELLAMYEKIEYLTSLAYPEYMAEDNNKAMIRMKAPFTELHVAHIGSRNKGQFGFIKTLTYTVSEAGDWDADTNLAKLIDVSISYQILNQKPPGLNRDKFYGDKKLGIFSGTTRANT